MTDPNKKKIIIDNEGEESKESLPVNDYIDDENEEIDSDGSASAFDETESVNEDNFDDLKEK
jgi:hypothetical protein